MQCGWRSTALHSPGSIASTWCTGIPKQGELDLLELTQLPEMESGHFKSALVTFASGKAAKAVNGALINVQGLAVASC